MEKTCEADAALRERVLAMLEFHDRNSDFLAEDTFDHSLVGERVSEVLGSVTGNYRLLEEIGEGASALSIWHPARSSGRSTAGQASSGTLQP